MPNQRGRDRYDDDYDDYGDRPRRSASHGRSQKKSGSNNTVIWVVVGVAGFVFLLCAGFVGFFVYQGFQVGKQAVGVARAAARSNVSRNNLKQIGLGAHNFHDVHNAFPTGDVLADTGGDQHSWQTQLLPYVGHEAVYRGLDLQQPWDAPANSVPMRTMVPAYVDFGNNQNHDAQGYALSHFAGNSHVLLRDKRFRIPDVLDGTTNTILAGEAAGAFKAWGDPTNLRDPAAGLNAGPIGFGGPSELGCSFLMCDGSVRVIRAEVDPQVLKALSTPDGKESVPLGQF